MDDLQAVKNVLLRGNLVVIASAVSLGFVFGYLALAISSGLIAPLVGAALGIDEFIGFGPTINGNHLQLGYTISLLITFALALAATYLVLRVRGRE